jgi:hypothetical protein
MRRAHFALVAGLLLAPGLACGSAPNRRDSAFCQQVRDLQNTDPLAGVNGDAQAIQQGKAVFDKLEQSAPVSLKNDLRTLSHTLDQLAGIDQNDPAAPDKAAKVVTDSKVLSAANSLQNYAQNTCGVSFGADSNSSDTPDSSDDTDLGTTGDSGPADTAIMPPATAGPPSPTVTAPTVTTPTDYSPSTTG